MAAVANFDPSETAGDGLLCSVCGEECALQDSGTHELRLCRYSCARPGSNCDWRLCYFCANGLRAGKAVVCGVCGISVRDADAAHDYSADGLSGDSEEEVDDDHHQPHEDAYDEDCGSWQGGRGRGRGSGVGQSAHRTHAGANQAAPPAAAAIDDMFAMGLPTGMPSLPSAVPSSVPSRSAFVADSSSRQVQKKRVRDRDDDNDSGEDFDSHGEDSDEGSSDAAAARFPSRMLHCRDCGQRFEFTSAEQQALSDRGQPILKTRCAGCKQYKKNRFAAKVRDESAGGGKEQARASQQGKGRGKGGKKGQGGFKQRGRGR